MQGDLLHMILEWVFGIATALLGGLNIFQWITLKSYKRVKEAEADSKDIENLRLIIQTMQEQIDRLKERVEDAEQRAQDNHDRYIALQDEFDKYKAMHK